MMNFCCIMVDWQKVLRLIFSWGQCIRLSRSQTFNMQQVESGCSQNLSPNWHCWMYFCCNGNHCTTAPLFLIVFQGWFWRTTSLNFHISMLTFSIFSWSNFDFPVSLKVLYFIFCRLFSFQTGSVCKSIQSMLMFLKTLFLLFYAFATNHSCISQSS